MRKHLRTGLTGLAIVLITAAGVFLVRRGREQPRRHAEANRAFPRKDSKGPTPGTRPLGSTAHRSPRKSRRSQQIRPAQTHRRARRHPPTKPNTSRITIAPNRPPLNRTGIGSTSIGTMRLVAHTRVRWTCSGGRFALLYGTSGVAVNSSGLRGDLTAPAGTYAHVRIRSHCAWTVSLTPRDGP